MRENDLSRRLTQMNADNWGEPLGETRGCDHSAAGENLYINAAASLGTDRLYGGDLKLGKARAAGL